MGTTHATEPGTKLPTGPDTPAGSDTSSDPTMADQAPLLLGMVAGYMGHRTVAMGLRTGLVAALADRPGATVEQLATGLDLDDFYTSVWCRGGVSCGLLERDGEGFRLAPHLDTLLLDIDSPAHIGGVFQVTTEPEMFDSFEQRLSTGERTWWDETSDDWIEGVSGTGRPFYTRLIRSGLAEVPGVADALEDGCRVVDTACGTGNGVIRLAQAHPTCEVIGVDGDGRSLKIARERAGEAGVGDRVSFLHNTLEDFTLEEPAAIVVNNISMHECRDMDAATRQVREVLEPGGVFVISDFPFPDTDVGLRTLPGRIMAGIQFFEAQIDDQLLPRSTYDDLLRRHGFEALGSSELTPTHALTWGRAPTTS